MKKFVVAVAVLALLAGDALAGPFARFRERRSGGCASGSCAAPVSPGTTVFRPHVPASFGGCVGGTCAVK